MRYRYIIMAVAAASMAVSCKDMLDQAPADQIASGNMWTSESLADKGMAGLYVNFYREDLSRIQLRHNDMTGINRQGWMGVEFQTDFVSDNYHLMHLAKATKDATEFTVWYDWKWTYTTIHACNDALENLHRAGLPEEKYNRYICEARFLRAWAYSRLAKIYGEAPIYLNVISNEECVKGQSSNADLWQVVIDDCTECIDNPHMPDNTLTVNYGRPSKGAVYALRGMAYIFLKDWDKAIEDFDDVARCGYGLWQGKFIDFFHYSNEKDREMIFPLQFGPDAGYSDNLQLMIGGRDTWNGWSNVRPSSDFVDYFQNADGTAFHWNEVPGLEDWDKLEPYQREVYFLRDGIKSKSWDAAAQSVFKERIAKIGQAIFDRYYIDNGNEDRIRAAYNNRDPRLKDICLVPYDPYDTFKDASDNEGKIQIGKELRWPFLKEGNDYGDYYTGDYQSMYVYKKYSYNKPEDLDDRLRCHTDWPLIRYTDVVLLKAEALAQEGRLSEAADIVNDIRARAGMPGISAGSKEEMLEAVRYERRVELCLEGSNYFDEWRWGTYKMMKFQGRDVYGGQSWWKEWEGYNYNWYYTDDMYPWAAPSGECQRNPNLKRKNGWAY